jgi:photosystem II oxygen-evolving enhancer protein 2
MLKRLVLVCLVVVAFTLNGCVSPSSGFMVFKDIKDGYRFLYPNGWQEARVNANNGVDVLIHDIIEPSENVSVVIGKLQSVKDLHEIGSASDVGLRVLQRVIAPNLSKDAELLSASEREVNGRTYYSLEYAVKRPNGELRHDLVSVTANRGNLYTLSVSAKASRWGKVKDLFQRVADSFVVQ